jgi:ribonuclease-3
MTPDQELLSEVTRLDRAQVVAAHVFADRSLLLRALTHRSYLNEHTTTVGHNEVLELLGDAVVSLVVVEQLVASSPDAEEGRLTERRAAHVSTENLAKAAVRTGLGELLRTGNGLRPHGQLSENLAADVVEAVLGAVFQDGGLVAARQSVQALLGPPPVAVVVAATHAKRVLQERLQRIFGKAPEYVVTRGDGPNHAPHYKATVAFAGQSLGEGTGKNKRTATEEAAAAAVAALSSIDDPALRERLALKIHP